MKANSRRRVLISSVAMLLVALVALGTSTFAWFTSDPTANASGVNVKSTASEGLLINAAQENIWTHTATIAKTSGNQTLAPASFDLGTWDGVAYTTKAEKDGAYGAKSDEAVTATGTSYSEVIAAKITGVAANTKKNVQVTGVTITGHDSTDSVKKTDAAVRVAITFKASGATSETLLGVWANETSNKYLTEVGKYSEVLSTSAYTFKTGASESVQVGTDGADQFKVYLYLDGESANCYSQNIPLSQLGADIKVDFAIVNETTGD